MKVRGWLITGTSPMTGMLAPPEPIPMHFGAIPDATTFQPGQIIEWLAAPGASRVVLVCVDIPL